MLNQEHRDLLAKKLIEAAVFYGKADLTRESITTTINVYETFFKRSIEEYIFAIDNYMKDPKNIQYPIPAKLRPYLDPQLDDDSKAVEVASRVIAAVSKFGWPDPQNAQAYIGELGWQAVKRFGGWQFICENLGNEISMTTFQAQIRDMSKAMIKTAEIGSFDQPVALPGPIGKVLELANIKTIGAPKEGA